MKSIVPRASSSPKMSVSITGSSPSFSPTVDRRKKEKYEGDLINQIDYREKERERERDRRERE